MARTYDVAVMHDFFVDRLVDVGTLRSLGTRMVQKGAEGGGGIHGVSQSEVRGGNAVNMAHALARLGLRTLLITHAEEAHMHLLRSTFEGLGVDLSVKPLAAGLTVALEGEVNVMLGDSRGAGGFGPELLSNADWKALEESKVVCVVNWAANGRGTELVRGLRRRLGPEKPLFFDPADFRDRIGEFGGFLRKAAAERTLDWVSMNHQEGLAAASALGHRTKSKREACLYLASALRVVFDLHGFPWAFTSEGLSVTAARSLKVSPLRLTGAGDVWDAGAIFGRLRGYDEQKRLEFANEAARLYLSSEEPVPPTLDQVLRVV